eukprot:Sspe_Gene.51846::Locus_28762_Transcript_1_1_Confidence_1.000_Length_805::g.51846::m.51846
MAEGHVPFAKWQYHELMRHLERSNLEVDDLDGMDKREVIDTLQMIGLSCNLEGIADWIVGRNRNKRRRVEQPPKMQKAPSSARMYKDLAHQLRFPMEDTIVDDLRRLVAYEALHLAAEKEHFTAADLETRMSETLAGLLEECRLGKFPSMVGDAIRMADVHNAYGGKLEQFLQEEVPFIEKDGSSLRLVLVDKSTSKRDMSIIRYVTGKPRNP